MQFFGLIGGALATGFLYGHGGTDLLMLLPLFLVVGSVVLLFEAASFEPSHESKTRTRLPNTGRTRLHLR